MEKAVILARHTVAEGTARIRLQDYVGLAFEFASRKAGKRAIVQKRVLINGDVGHSGDWILPGQELTLLAPEEEKRPVYAHDLEVVHEDEDLALIIKPAGMVTSGNQHRTLLNALPHNLKKSTAVDALPRPLPVHRLDSATSGLVLVAKTASARVDLGRQLEHREVQKQYVALVAGQLPPEGDITTPVDDKKAHSSYWVLQTVPSLSYEKVTMVRLSPHTGRTHQLRIHMAEMACPIIGDRLYGQEGKVLKGKGLFLSAVSLRFTHPHSREEIFFEVDPPSKFQAHMDRELRRYETFRSEGKA